MALYARVNRSSIRRPTIHTWNGNPMPHPDVLVIEPTNEGTFLLRYTAGGEFGGDTWHESVDDAIAQARAEYGGAVGKWIGVPDDVNDAASYAIRSVAHGGQV